MRAGLSTIQQTLTPEAASILNQSIAEAARRNHGQTTPLHVAATLLSSPSGYLRQACIRSHPNSSHPLQCRALELCFSVALERLPSAQNLSPGLEPPISNALMAALKRAQAHQRRGCPEQQQQPLLAVKVELEQLIVSILDDPSVSRVMREASFSSPAVKATIEQSLNSTSSVVKSSSSIGSGLVFRPAPMANRNLYLNPRLQQQGNSDESGHQRKDEVKKVFDVLLKTKKRNPVLVGDSEPEPVIRELLQKIEKRDLEEDTLKNVQVISLDKDFTSDRTQISAKVKELGDSIKTQMDNSNGGGVILNLGDLKWLVEQNLGFGNSGSHPMQQQQMVSELGRTAVTEMGKLLGRFGEGSNGKLWLIGTATCETYLRCQVYHPSMENDWDLQAVPVAARNPPPGLFPRLGGTGILSSSVESLSPLKGFSTGASALSRRPSESTDTSLRTSCCPQCIANYEKEVAKLATESEKSVSDSKQELARKNLPQWLQIAKPQNDNVNSTDNSNNGDQEMIVKQKTKEIQKKWNDACLRLHPSFHRHNLSSERITPTGMPTANLYKSNLLNRHFLQPNLQTSKNLGGTLQMNRNISLNPPERRATPPGSPVRTELILGTSKLQENTLEKNHMERVRDLTGCISSDPLIKTFEVQKNKLASTLDPDSFKSLLKGLLEKVWWQPDAASAVASSVVQSKSGNSKRRGGLKGDTWLLFTGPDRIGKKKMATTLSELAGRQLPITIRLGSRSDEDEESDTHVRGKTTLDRIAEAVRRNPFSVIVLEDIDRADMLVHGSIKRAMDRGRLPDSHGREISLGNVIFILTADWLPESVKNFPDSTPLNEDKLSSTAQNGWELKLSIGGKTGKRRPDWLRDEIRSTKPKTDMGSALSFDLNQAAVTEEDMTDESRNSSGVTIEHEQEQSFLLKKNQVPITTSTIELFNSVDDEIIFKPVEFGPIRSKVAATISSRFLSIIGVKWSITVDEEALEQIVAGVWFSQTGMEEWVDRILVPNFHQLKSTSLASDENVAVKIVLVRRSSEKSNHGDWLPSKVTIALEES